MTTTFDTLRFANRLKSAGVPDNQAEAFAEAFRDAQGETDLVTKADLRAEIAGVRTEIERMGRTLIMWMVGIAIGAMAAMTGILYALIKAMVPGA
jgi:hypothetical protein